MKKHTSKQEGKRSVFDTNCEIAIGGKTYLLERHFTGKRDFRQAVFSAVINEAKRENPVRESA
jgi:hypothetical protein